MCALCIPARGPSNIPKIRIQNSAVVPSYRYVASTYLVCLPLLRKTAGVYPILPILELPRAYPCLPPRILVPPTASLAGACAGPPWWTCPPCGLAPRGGNRPTKRSRSGRDVSSNVSLSSFNCRLSTSLVPLFQRSSGAQAQGGKEFGGERRIERQGQSAL